MTENRLWLPEVVGGGESNGWKGSKSKKEKERKYLHDLGIGKSTLNKVQKAQAIKEMIYKIDYTKCLIFCLSRNIIGELEKPHNERRD